MIIYLIMFDIYIIYVFIYSYFHTFASACDDGVAHAYICSSEIDGDAVDYEFEVVVVLSVHVADVFVAYIRTIYYVQLYRTVRYATVRYGTVISATLRLKTKNRVNVYQKSLTPSKITLTFI